MRELINEGIREGVNEGRRRFQAVSCKL